MEWTTEHTVEQFYSFCIITNVSGILNEVLTSGLCIIAMIFQNKKNEMNDTLITVSQF